MTDWASLPGMDFRTAAAVERDAADRVLAMQCTLLHAKIDHNRLAHGSLGKQFDDLFEMFMDWLSPAEGDRHTAADPWGLSRRFALRDACVAMPAGLNAAIIMAVAEAMYERYLDPPMGRDQRRRFTPRLDRRRRVRAAA